MFPASQEAETRSAVALTFGRLSFLSWVPLCGLFVIRKNDPELAYHGISRKAFMASLKKKSRISSRSSQL
jgi:hypothetical protein